MTPFMVALLLACPLLLSLRSESVELLRGTEPRFLDLDARLLICRKLGYPFWREARGSSGMSRVDGYESGVPSAMGVRVDAGIDVRKSFE